ncbi:hypothetical protein MCOR07_003291 [Pyricularia oryzae]|uniref:Cytochrome P450 n=2 Tax=Pyricularia grisea TaxID=148305 RepID=A0ABQ8NZX6_PYRGI|nr:hypothetical protein MCOR01_007659 [Pyricularia oryzae]KAI6304547.1 hypothetical protein MCOR33_000404 [Pyricularia grisea]KAI6262545.1 hypothetical protein MCOR19_001246 [Pyricularia oryzae]KAI6286816.1 hypothetical protein MCOR26_000795 [Pyricularia oryzae]KAI6315953.1 hypothetical protein MCOR34_004486 [Pyricularia oryzae]
MTLLEFSPWAPAILVPVALIVLYTFLAAPRLKRNGIPLKTPRDSLPFVGNGIVFLQPRQKLFAWFHQREREFGLETYQITVPTLPPGVVISDPMCLEYVFKNETLFNKGAFFKERSDDLFGHGIINVDGEPWRAQRKAGLNFLNTTNLRVLTDVALPRYLNENIGWLKNKADGETVADLQEVFHRITSQLMGKMAYNMEMHAGDDFSVAFDYASGATAERFQNPLWFITEFFTGSRLRRSLAIVKEHGRKIVANATCDRKAAEKLSATLPGVDADSEHDGLEEISGSLIQSLLDCIGDEKLVADAALNYLSAGRDTVAQALTWTSYLLMQHPEAIERIRAETAELISPMDGSAGNNTTLLKPPSAPYTMAVFYETMRFYPPIPFEIKQCVRETTLPDGTFLPASSVVVWCPWAMNRSKAIWGSDVDEFRPERWLSLDGKSFASRSAAEYPVFNGGARMCLGKKMADIIAVQVLPSIVTNFDFRPAYEKQQERVSKSSLTLPMQDGLPVFVKRRDVAR